VNLSLGLSLGSNVKKTILSYLVEYRLTSSLTTDGTFSYTENTGSSNVDGKLILLSNGVAWNPISGGAEYPEDGTINLSGGYAIDTQVIFPSDLEWSLPLTYNIDGAGNYDLAIINYKGDGIANIWRGNQSTYFTLSDDDTGLSYVPPLSSYKIEEIPKLPAKVIWTFEGIIDITDTIAHSITITSNTYIDPSTFSVADITVSVEANGTISNLIQTANPLVWTFDFAADTVTDTTNVFTIGTAITDLWGNLPSSTSVSSNFEIDVTNILGPELVTNGMFDTDLAGWTVGTWVWGSGGIATDSTVGGYDTFTQNGVPTSNYTTKQYRVSYDVVGAVGGGARIKFNNVYLNDYQSNGSYTYDTTTTTSLSQVLILSNSSFSGSVDNISVKEIL